MIKIKGLRGLFPYQKTKLDKKAKKMKKSLQREK